MANNIELKAMWLNSRGGRSMRDVEKDQFGEYVLMAVSGGGAEKVYIPSDEEIRQDLIEKRPYDCKT